jgi:O-methyltransferase involved in polyketide biosynthesis
MPGFRGWSAISPTGLYTGHVWVRHGLSDPRLDTPVGGLIHWSLTPLLTVTRHVGGPDLDGFLLARHRAIDARLARAIDEGQVASVLELASGLSGRGLRFARRYGGAITYMEGDLAAMAATKRARVRSLDDPPQSLRVVTLDAFAEDGRFSLEAAAAPLDRKGGLAVISEGLLNYCPRADVERLWHRIGDLMGGFRRGLYVADLMPRTAVRNPFTALGATALGAVVGGQLHFGFSDAADVRLALDRAGFEQVEVTSPEGGAGAGRHLLVLAAGRGRP